MSFQDSFNNFSKRLKEEAGKAASSVKKTVNSAKDSLSDAAEQMKNRISSGSKASGSSGSKAADARTKRTASQSGSSQNRQSAGFNQAKDSPDRNTSGARPAQTGSSRGGLYSTAPAPRKRSAALKKPRRKKTDAERPLGVVIARRFGRYATRTVATLLLICLITGCIVSATAMVYVLAFLDKDISDINLANLKLNYTTTIYAYDSDGELVEYETLHSSENRVWVDYSDMNQYIKDAAVAVEDERFWEHHGVDWKSTAYACLNMFFNIDGTARGGSTITQQLIKNVTNEDEQSVSRKLKEIFKALELEKVYTKEQILEAYLNVIALGSGCNGIQTAAQTYFGKDAADLTLAESAAIIGITKYPSLYNPFLHPEENKTRQEYVLSKMLENGYITQAEYDAAIAEDYLSKLNTSSQSTTTTTTYWSWYTEQVYADVLNDLQEQKGMTESEAINEIYTGGLNIYANVDIELQEIAEEIFSDSTGDSDYWDKFPQTVQPQCAIAILNYEGEIKAIVGSRGTKSANLLQNHASQSRRQPGSAIKPLSAYGLAVELGAIEYSSPVSDTQITITENGVTTAWPRNSGNKYRGDITVIKGLEVSANCVAARIVRYITPQKSYQFLTERLSITLNASDNAIAPMAVGALTDGVTVLEMASAYVIFGSNGVYYSPASYSLVTDYNGSTVLENTTARGTQAMSEESATIMNYMLRAPVEGSEGTARNAKISGFTVFGKTGTTSDNKDRYFVGGTPYYVGACWFGYADNSELEYTSKNYAMWAWKYVMEAAHKGLESKEFSLSSNVVARQYCTVTGGLATANCTSTATGYYSTSSSIPLCPLHGGGTASSSFTALLENPGVFTTTTTTTTTQAETTTTTSTTAATTTSTEAEHEED